MGFPETPFGDGFPLEVLWELGDGKEANVEKRAVLDFQSLVKWLCQPPGITSFRVNTEKSDVGDVLDRIRKHLGNNVVVDIFPPLPEVILVRHPPSNAILKKYDQEIIIDPTCGAAVLRGAHIYAPGVIAMMTRTSIGNYVSVYVDLEKKCRKGFARKYEGEKVHVGNGLVQLERYQLFCETPQKGIAIQMVETTSNCPCLGDDLFPPGVALLQNLPSIICVHVLNPQSEDTILDMCASPGNKTTHIAAFTNNTARLVAIDKTPPKVAQLKARCEIFNANVEILQADSTILIEKSILMPETFDKILLDAPCSALGKRPQLVNNTTKKVIRSFVPLQRRLFENAVQLLKINGILVYSTCTITLAENEGIVEWALKKFDLELVEASPILGGPGLQGTSLTNEEVKKVQRFGPQQSIDSVGFFIAKFVKKI